MKNVSLKTAALFAALTTGTSLSALSSTLPDRPIPPEAINMCTEKIRQNADFSLAAKVVHRIEVRPRRSIGVKLAVQTSVFGPDSDDLLARYQSVCVVTKGSEPYQFQIQALTPDLVAVVN